MINQFTIGTPLTIVWHFKKPDGSPFSLGGLQHTVTCSNSRGSSVIASSVINLELGTVSFSITKEMQTATGPYSFLISLFQNGVRVNSVRYDAAIMLVRGASDSQSIQHVKGEETTVELFSVGEFNLFVPTAPIAGTDGYWYYDGKKIVDDDGAFVPCNHTIYIEEDATKADYGTIYLDRGRDFAETIYGFKNIIVELRAAEALRVEAEEERKESEQERRANETSRQGAELIRVEAENTRNARYEEAEASRQAEFDRNETDRQEEFDNDFGKVKFLADHAVFYQDGEKSIENLDANYLSRLANAENNIKSLAVEQSATKELVENVTKQWNVIFDTDWTYDYSFVRGNVYNVSNLGAGHPSLYLYNKNGVSVQTIDESGVFANSPIVFVANEDAAGIGGYANANTTLKLETMNSSFDALDRKLMNEFGWRHTYNLSAQADWSKPLNFIKGEKYVFSNNSTDYATLLYLRNSSTGASQQIMDSVHGAEIYPGVHEFTANGNYDLMTGYATGNMSVTIETKDKVYPRLSDCETKIGGYDDTIDRLSRTLYGVHNESSKTFNVVDCWIKHPVKVVSGDTVSAQYSLSTNDLRIFALFGCKEDGSFNENDLLAQSEYNSGNSGIISFIATRGYACVWSYTQRTVQSGATTISVTMDAKEGASSGDATSPDVNVLSYGADNTGVTDSTSALQNAIIDAIAKHKNVYLPYGIYKVSETIKINTNQPLVIHGFAKDMSGMNYGTVIKASKDVTKLFDIKNTTAEANKIIIRDMMIDGNGHVSEAIVYVTNPYIEMERVYVINSQGHGIMAKDCYYAKFKDILVKAATKNGLYLLNQANVVRVVDSQITCNGLSDGYSNIKIESDGLSSSHKNCNVVIDSCDLSSTGSVPDETKPSTLTDGTNSTSIEVKNSLAVSIRNCYMESFKKCEQSNNYYHIKIDESVDAVTIMSNFIMNGNVRVASEKGAVIGNDFCTQAVYDNEWDGEPYTSTAKKLYVVDGIQDIANNFYAGFTKQTILGEA